MKIKTMICCALSLLISNYSLGNTYNLRLGHFWPAGSSVDKILSQWVNQVEESSGGELKIDIYPSQTLAKAPQSYSSAVSGVLDIAVTAQGYTAGKFPLTQIIELPGIASSAENSSCVLQTLYDDGYISSEYRDTRPIFFFAHGPGHIHTSSNKIVKPEDLEGLRIRRATTVVADILTSFDAKPVGIAAPETYTSVQRKVIDGVAFPWQAMKDFRLNDELKFHTEMSLYTLSFVATMNKRTYSKLPDHLKKIINDNSGMPWARTMGDALDQLDKEGREQALSAGHFIYTIDDIMNNPDWKPALDQVVEEYLSSVSNPNINALEIYQAAQEYKNQCG